MNKNDTTLKKENKISTEFKGVKAEFRRIVWPSKDVLVKQTISVIIVSIIIGAIIFFYDTFFEFFLNLLVSIF